MASSKDTLSWLFLLCVLQLISTSGCIAQNFSGEVFAGTAWNLPMPLKISQPGEIDIKFKARYNTRPWRGAPYYAYRIGYKQWSAELLHHKIYLQNPPPEIEHFEVSHGYNLVMINRNMAGINSPAIFRIGLGMVVAHPEGIIRGKAIHPVQSLLSGGYHISGACLQMAVGPQLNIGGHWFIRPEAKLTASWAKMPLLHGGVATVPNVALHTLIGVGIK